MKKNNYFLLILLLVPVLYGSYFLINNRVPITHNETGSQINSSSVSSLEFNTTWGGSESDESRAVSVDSVGNIYITGQSGADNVFLAKYNTTGDLQWTKYWNDGAYEYAEGIAIDNSDNIYITGKIIRMTYPFRIDMFLIKYDSMGQFQFSFIKYGFDSIGGNDVAVDGSDNIYITGTVSDSLLLAKYNSGGDEQWIRTWGGSESESGNSIALDGSGNIFITGYTSSFGAQGSDMFLAKYDGTGTRQWNTTWGGSGNDYGKSIALDNSSNIFITGYTEDSSGENRDMFFAKYDGTGTRQWNTTWGGSERDSGRGIALDRSGHIYITGNTNLTGNTDIFLAQYDETGARQWITTWGGNDDDNGKDVSVYNSENIYITGETNSFGRQHSDAILLKYSSQSSNNGTAKISGYLYIPIFTSIIICLVISARNIKKRKI